MPAPTPCSDVQALNQFVTGGLLDQEIALLEEHLEQCDRCAGALNTLVAQDTLLADLKAQKSAPQEQTGEAVRALIQRLRGLRAAGVQVPAHGEATQAPAASENTQELHDFLAPARGPGEIGWLAGYRVLKVLGSGGMGVVFLAEDPSLKRQVALKAMLPAVAASASARQRFLREAQTTAAIENDHIVSIYQVSEDKNIPFLAMPLLKGEPLDQWLERGRKATVAQILRLGRETAKGLAAAHANGLIHRDIKPGNIWLEAPQGRVKILDFGLARAVDDKTHLTQPGAVAGTPAFMAPEQAKGEAVDHRCDLFSLGCVLYRLCTGELPFKGTNTIAVLTALALHDPKPVAELNRDIPPALAALVMQLLAKDPALRPASAKAVVQMIQAIETSLAGAGAVMAASLSPAESANPGQQITEAVQPIAASPDKPQHSVGRGSIRRKPLLIAGAAVLLAGVALAGWVIIRDKDNKIVARIPIPGGGSAEVVHDKPPLPPGSAEPADRLRREVIPPALLAAAGDGDPKKVPPEVVAIVDVGVAEKARVGSVSFSPDGKTLACGMGFTLVKLIDAATGKVTRTIKTAATGNAYVAFSPDGQSLAVASKGLRLFSLSAGQDVRTLDDTKGYRTVAFRPDGQLLAAAGYDKTIQLWEINTGKELRSLSVQGSQAEGLAFSPDSKVLASGGADGTIQLWNASDGEGMRSWRGYNRAIYALAFSPDGQTLASAGHVKVKGYAKLWKVATGAEIITLPDVSKGAEPSWPRSLAFRADGQVLAVGNDNGIVQLFDPKKLVQTQAIEVLSSGLRRAGIVGVAFSPGGRYLATADSTAETVTILRLGAPPDR